MAASDRAWMLEIQVQERMNATGWYTWAVVVDGEVWANGKTLSYRLAVEMAAAALSLWCKE